MKVKICGLTNKDDATWALNYGADYLGVNFWKDSKRHVSLASASAWVPQLPGFAAVVGVFVDAGQDEILSTVMKLNLKGVQLHGEESPAMVSALRIALDGTGKKIFIIKVFRMKDEETLNVMEAYKDSVDYYLLDAYHPEEPGGTGERFNWDLAVKAKSFGKPIFLAGGLNPGNVKEAVKKAGPFAVDVASGVEKSPKKKDFEKVREFIEHAKN